MHTFSILLTHHASKRPHRPQPSAKHPAGSGTGLTFSWASKNGRAASQGVPTDTEDKDRRVGAAQRSKKRRFQPPNKSLLSVCDAALLAKPFILPVCARLILVASRPEARSSISEPVLFPISSHPVPPSMSTTSIATK
jgi:hypothetical protein